MRTLVTGGAGYIGGVITEVWLERLRNELGFSPQRRALDEIITSAWQWMTENK